MVKKNNFFKYILLTIITIGFFSFSVTLGYIANLVKNQNILTYEEMKEDINNISINSDVYFSNGEKVATINYELMRKAIPLYKMGENIKNAIIASEDANFYNNSGIDTVGLFRATINEITKSSNSGGSTITQQLVKNQLLDSSRSYERKAKEILLSLRITKYFSKDEILEAYLNMAPFGKNKLGQNISGIETASKGVFGISASELNISQAAYLAGFVQSPFKYTPFDAAGNIRPDEELQAGFDRQKYVLNRMLAVGFINENEYNEAINFDIKKSFVKEIYDERQDYPYIIDEIINSASEILAENIAKENNELEKYKKDLEFRNVLLEKTRLQFVTGGYKVSTTIDKNLYDLLEQAKNNYNGFITKNIKGKVESLQVGATLIDNKTGKILAFIGGNDYNKQQLNHATRTTRSPGSTIKPLLVYAPAIDKGYITPQSLLLDKRFNFKGWKPENFSKTEYGIITAKNALAKSLNLSTIRLYSAFYSENPVKEYLEKMNFSAITTADEQNLSAAIGGLAYGVTVTENTSAFATFANEGKFKKPYIIENIKDKNGKIIYKENSNPIQVYSKEASYLILNMLNEVLTANGTAPDIAASAKFKTNNLFVKTGTSEFNYDLWAVGGTKNITFGLWTGYDTPAEINGYNHAHNQWIYFMNHIHSYDPVLIGADEKFERPNSIINKNINNFNNSPGSVLDIVPTNFQELTKQKTLLKLGYNIDKSVEFITYKPPVKEEKENDDKNENNEEIIIVKPEEIIIEDNSDENE